MSTATKVERTAVHLQTQPILGDPTCTTNPTDCCGGGDNIAGVSMRVEKRRWTLPAGAWIGETWCEDFETCCNASGSASTGPILTACCSYALSQTLTCLATISGITTIYNANWNGSYWVVNHPSMYALRCNGTTWEVGYDSGGSMVWTAASGRCTPDFFWGITVGGDSISFVGSAADESMPGGATYRLRVQKTRVYLPATATVGDPRCVSVPEDCCEDNVTGGVDLTCCTGKQYGRVLYVGLSNVVGCPELEGFVIPITFSVTGGGGLGAGWSGGANYNQSGTTTCSMVASVGCLNASTLRLTVAISNQGGGISTCGATVIFDIPCPSEPLYFQSPTTFTFSKTGLGTPCDPNPPCCNGPTVTADVVLFE